MTRVGDVFDGWRPLHWRSSSGALLPPYGGNMKTIASVITFAAILSSGGFIKPLVAQKAHVIQTPAEPQGGPAPPRLPPGAQIAVLAGDPTKSVPYAVRLKFPANYAIPAHSHPTDEHVVVV